MQCLEVEKNAEEEITRPSPAAEMDSTHNTHLQARSGRKRYSGVALFAVMTVVGTSAGLAWLYYYAVTTLQSALLLFKP